MGKLFQVAVVACARIVRAACPVFALWTIALTTLAQDATAPLLTEPTSGLADLSDSGLGASAFAPLGGKPSEGPLASLTRRSQSAGMAEASSDDAGDPETRSWQGLPDGLIYHSYLAGEKEPRIGATWVYQRNWGWIWDNTLGGRVGLVRYGTRNPIAPEGFQIDLEGAAQPRLDIEHKEDVLATDYRFGLPVTFGTRQFQMKLAAYHLSSHMGDEYMIRLHSLDRINYSRNVLVWGNSYYWTDAVRLYAETGWAFYTAGGAEPWEFQFGIEYVPREPTGARPVPFVAINTHLRQEVNYGGNLVVQSGWAWRGEHGHLFRMGMQYYTGKSDQYELFNQFEDKVGLGLWYDF